MALIIGCKLPHGLKLKLDGHADIIINGLNKATIIGSDAAFTSVDEGFWSAWEAKHKGFAPLTSGALFVAKNSSDAQAKAKEVAGEVTGFEPMPQEDKTGKIKKAKD